jgi:SNF2 family DNA or RNA helicase
LKLHQYQRNGANFAVSRLYAEGQKGAGLLFDPGLGKTLTTLSVIDAAKMIGEANAVLIVAPLRVVHNVWPTEIAKWGFDLTCSIVSGSPNQRVKALNAKADIYLTNPENLPWLFLQKFKPNFDLLVIDESTKFKNWTGKRTKALRKLLPSIPKRIILTGTPSPNSLADLFAQMYILDDGEALGQTITYFRNRFQKKGGYLGREWLLQDGAERGIEASIGHLVYRLKAEDHLDLPPLLFNDVLVDLPSPIAKAYKQIERELFAALSNGDTLTASSAGAKYALCKGISNGGAYQTDDNTGERREIYVHEEKINAAEEIVEELSGKPVLIAYQCDHTWRQLQKRWPKAPVIRGGLKQDECQKILNDWNAGLLRVLLCQPQAMSHGLNMQAGGNDLIWIGLTDSLEVYDQLNRRLYRQGVTGTVRIHHILARNTVDLVMLDRLKNKDQQQKSLLDALNEYRKENH